MVIRNGGLGDTLLLVPFFRRLRYEFPTRELHGMGRKEALDILVREGEIHTALSFDQDGMWRFFSSREKLTGSLASLFSSYERIFSLVNDVDGLFTANLKRACGGTVASAAPFPPPTFSWHVSRYYADIAGGGPELAADIEGDSIFTRPFAQREGEFSDLVPYLRGWGVDLSKDRLLALHPGSGSPYKNWPVESFREVARILAKRGWKILWILGPVEEEGERDFAAPENNVFPVTLPLPQLASLLKYCSFYMGNDSGVSHLAGWAGLPAVILFGPSDPLLWKPLGLGVKILSRGLECSPCPQGEWKNCAERRCLLGISVEEVLAFTTKALGEGKGGKRN